MKRLFYIFLVFVIGNSTIAQAQLDSIQQLDEVVLSDNKLKLYAKGHKITVLTDSVLQKNNGTLTDVLRYNSNLYFNENGYGMVSSVSFRGTNASQTAVVWNGININSQLNGQVDFNTFNTFNYDAVEIRSGGGSVQYGSGAIGGSVHLSNALTFNTHTDHTIRMGYGSFDTKRANYRLSTGEDQWSLNLGVGYVDSENDYKYLGSSQRNLNGQFNNLSFNLNAGYFIDKKNVLKLYHQSYIGDRNFSGTRVAPSKSRYEDTNYRSMLEWGMFQNDFTSKLKVVHLFEAFKYFENKDADRYSFGNVASFIGNHTLNYKLNSAIEVRSVLEFSKYSADGDSFGNPSRDAFSTTGLWRHQLSEVFNYGVNIRKEFTSGFSSPVVFSADAEYRINRSYAIKINGSKNYRVPSFNDLYWNPGGNLELVPELSYQVDLGHEFSSRFMDVKFNTYYIKTKDMIQWVPDHTGLFRPQNVSKVRNYGAELELILKYHLNGHQFNLNSGYSYTVSENAETDQQLIYVPFHKASVNLSYGYKAMELFYQHLINGEVAIIGGQLQGYNVGNLGLSYHYTMFDNLATILQFNINNIYNSPYENVALRPMPNRNYQLQLTLKF
ncbi:TonB-dependent receptor [Gelidibacter salicanalis]|uniref:TonB-dependent receptor n=1 Tax=Gelidibacter salicanalis TaxID=291193 RepID=A0A5C7AVX1_9FLAO|nr:TonB-dependent receptor [Gelidibacter salicanalis]TXE10695.1 TonB-dependent receptor [Gelidibacter salicanalis]